jgi:hypothetical protein
MNETLNGRSGSRTHPEPSRLHRRALQFEGYRMNRPAAMAQTARVALAAAALLSFGAGPALAQSGPYTEKSPQGYYYDPCKRETNSRGTAGGLIGAAMGAVIGSNVAARNARTEGAVLGGLLGAIAGGKVGSSSAACNSSYNNGPAYPTRADRRYDERSNDRYDSGYSARAEADDDAWARADADGAPYRVTERPATAEDCTLAESPIRMPDGRTETRFVRVCKGADGRYAVVD